MTIAKDFASKAAVAFVAAAMVISAFAPAAQAQTTEDLQKMINDLLAQVAALQSSTGQATSAAGVCPYTWTRDLNNGATGADVKMLQQFLNADVDTTVSATGAGSAGMETEYYGPATAAAVSKMQVKYRSDILSPANLVNPTGYFGPSSRAKANMLCASAPAVDEETEEGEEEESETVTLGGEASLDSYEADDASDDTIEEGSEDAEVAVFTAEFANGDASISRIDVAFTNATVGARAWDAFDTISLWVDGDKVAEADASSKNDYLGDENDGIIRFSGLDIVGMEDESVEITVAASIQDNLDAEELATAWTVTTESLRYFDADGVATTDTTLVDDETASFDIDVAGADDEIIVKTSSNDPDSETFQVKDNKKSDWYNVFTFDIDTDDSTNDIELTEVTVKVVTTVAGYNTLVNDAEIVIDGTTIDDVDVVLSTTTIAGDTATLTFNVDNDVVIDAGDRVEAELMLEFKSLALANEGATVKASITTGDVEGEGADDEISTGTATGEEHTLRTMGIAGELKGTPSAAVTVVDLATNDYATYSMTVEVTAFEQDVLISTNHATSVVYALENGAGVPAVAGSRTVNLTSTGDETVNPGYFTIFEGETKTVTIDVTYVPGVANTAARLALTTIKFDDATGVPAQTWTASPVTTYRTGLVTIVN